MLAPIRDTPDVAELHSDTRPFHVRTPNSRQLPVGESITRGALALLSTQPLTWAGSLVTTIVVPRLLGADALGQFAIVMTIATIAATATSLGISEFLVQRIAQQPATLRQDLGIAFLIQMLTTGFGALVIVLAAPLGAFPVTDLGLLYVGLLGMLIVPGQTVLLSSFRGRELHAQYAWFNAIGVVLGQMGGALALFAGAGVITYTAIICLSTIGVSVIGWKLAGLRPTLPPLGRSLLDQSREFIRGGFSFWVLTLNVAVTSGIDRVLLGLFVPAAEVGWYAAAYRVFTIPVFIPTLIVTPLFPALSRTARQPLTIRRTLLKTMRVVLLMMVPLAVGTVVISPDIPRVLGWPADFSSAGPMIAILAAQLPLVAVDMVLGVVLLAIGRQRAWVSVGIIATVLKIALDFLLIPAFENLWGNGAVGASIVTLVIELVMFIGAVILLPKHVLDPLMAWDAIRIVIAGLATFVVGGALLPLSLGLCVLGGAFTYGVVAVLLRVVSMQDVGPVWRQLLVRTQARRS